MDSKVFMILLGTIVSNPAYAQNVWKCTSSSGSITFQNTPCIGYSADQRERIKIDTVNHIGRGTTSGDKYQLRDPNRIRDSSGRIISVPGNDWSQQPSYSPPPSRNQGNSPPTVSATGQSCANIKARLDDIQYELRKGYRPQRGERLKRERDNLNSAYRGCR